MSKSSKNGFSLLELAFVMVVISIIIGGVTTGTNVIKQARLRSVINEATMYTDAVNLFQNKYGALPGDFTRASYYWGINCDSTPSNCNGNGDGMITYSKNASAYNDNEAIRAWQHLSLAGMIVGTYSGVSPSGTYETNSTNSPVSAFNNALWGFYWSGIYNPPGVSYVGDSEGNFIQQGGYTPNKEQQGVVMTPAEAYSIDNKMDDGYPRNGLVLGRSSPGDATGCFTAVTLTAPYNLNVDNVVCALKFVISKNPVLQ